MNFVRIIRLVSYACIFCLVSWVVSDTALAEKNEPQSPVAVNAQAEQTSNSNARTKSIPCTCRYQGMDFQQGEQICIRGSIAVCAMTLNNTSWNFNGDVCSPVS